MSVGRWFWTSVCAGALACAFDARAEMTRSAKTVSPGFELVEFVDAARPLRAFLLKADLAVEGLRLNVVNGRDRLCSICPVSKMAAVLEKKTGEKVVAGINGDFFEYSGNPFASRPFIGRTMRMSVSGGVLMQTGAEFKPGAYDSLYADANGKIRLGRVGFEGTVTLGGRDFPIHHVNTMTTYLPAAASQQPAAVGVFTALWPQVVPGDGVLVRLAAPLKGEKGAAVTRDFVVTGKIAKGERLPANDPLVAAVIGFGAAAKPVSAATGGGRVGWTFPGAEGEVRDLVGVWCRPLVDSAFCDTHELPNYPRTAFGLDTVRNRLCLFVVDGRQQRWSKSFPSREMAELLKKEGCDQVGQFDGGGSTTMWLDGRVVNRPSDLLGERPVGSGVFLSLAAPTALVSSTL